MSLWSSAFERYLEAHDLDACAALLREAKKSPLSKAARIYVRMSEGLYLTRRGHWERARAELARNLEEIRRLGAAPPAEAMTLGQLAIVAEHEGRLDEAERLLHRARLLFEQNGERNAAGRMLNNLAALLLTRGEPARAARFLAESRRLLEVPGEPAGTANLSSEDKEAAHLDRAFASGNLQQAAAATQRLFDLAWERQDLTRARHFAAGGLCLAEGRRDACGQRDFLLRLASVHRAEGDLLGTRQHLNRALEIARDSRIEDLPVVQALARLEAAAGDSEDAEHWLELALRKGERSGAPQAVISSLLTAGEASRLLRRFGPARRYLQEALSRSQQAGDARQVPRIFWELGKTAEEDRRPVEARGYFLQASEKAQELGDDSERREALRALSDLEEQQGRQVPAAETATLYDVEPFLAAGSFHLAAELLERCLERAVRTGIPRLEGMVHLRLGETRLRQGRSEDAARCFRASQAHGEAAGDPVLTAFSRLGLGQILQARGEYREARAEIHAALQGLEPFRLQPPAPWKKRDLEASLEQCRALLRTLDWKLTALAARDTGVRFSCRFARLLYEQGDIPRALAELAKARRQAEELSLPLLVEQIDALTRLMTFSGRSRWRRRLVRHRMSRLFREPPGFWRL